MKKGNLKSVKVDSCTPVQSRLLGTNEERVLNLIPSLYRDGLLEPLKGYEQEGKVYITQGNHRLRAIEYLNNGITLNGYTYKRNITTVLVDIIEKPTTSIVKEYQSNNGLNWSVLDTVSAIFDLQAGREPLLMPISDNYALKSICKVDKKTGNVSVELLPYVGEFTAAIDGKPLKPQQYKRLKDADNTDTGLLQVAGSTLAAAIEAGSKELTIVNYIESNKKKASISDCLTALGAPFSAANFTQVSKPYIVLTLGNSLSISEIMAAEAINPPEIPTLDNAPIEKITAKSEFKSVPLGALKTLLMALEDNIYTKAAFFKLIKKYGVDGLRQYLLADEEERAEMLSDNGESKSAKVKAAFKRLYRMVELSGDTELLDEAREFATLAGYPTK